MKLIRVIKKDSETQYPWEKVGEVLSTIYEMAHKHDKNFGMTKAFFLLEPNEKKINSYVQGPVPSTNFDSIKPLRLENAKAYYKEIMKVMDDYKKAMDYAEKTGKELQKKLDEMLKGMK